MAKAGVFVSRQLIARLPAGERGTPDNIGKLLWKKSGGKCFLCEAILNRAADRIVPDHDVPESEGDPNDVNRLVNLNLAHQDCNAFKRSHPTAPTSAFLKFRRFLSDKSSPLYSDTLTYFKVVPSKTHLTDDGNSVTFEFPDSSKRTVQVVEESNLNGTFRSCFVDVPIKALFHDEECQPRTI